MLLSLIIPVYNGEDTLQRCLKSLMKIRELDIEFIVINDGSKDYTQKIIDYFVEEDSRFRSIIQDNNGVSSARNTGLKESTGRYIGFLDADDEITDEFQNIIERLKCINSDIVTFCHYIKNANCMYANPRVLLNTGQNEISVLHNNFLSGHSNCVWNNIYSAQIIKENNLFFPENMSMGEDAVFNACYLMYCKNTYHLNDNGYIYYTDNEKSVSKLDKVSYLKDFIRVYDAYKILYNRTNSEHVKFNFYGAYYVDRVYYIIKNNKKRIGKLKKDELKNSDFYKKIMSEKYKSWRRELRKLYIRVFMVIK